MLVIEREQCLTSSAFPCAGFIPLIAKKVFQGRKKERAKAAFLRANVLQKVPSQKPREEFLREILGIVGSAALTSQKRISGNQ